MYLPCPSLKYTAWYTLVYIRALSESMCVILEKRVIPKLMIFMILLYIAVFEKGRYLVAAFAVSLACATLRYRLLKVSSVNDLPSRSYRTNLSSSSRRVAC